MKIILLTNEYPPHTYGGAGVHVEYLSRELARLDEGQHRIQIYCFGDQNETAGNTIVEGIPAPFDPASQGLRHEKLMDALLRDIVMTGKVQEGDIVHCHTWYTHLAGCLVKQILGIPLVLTTHSLEPQRPWKVDQLGAAYRASLWIEATAYTNADGIIAVSGPMRAAVRELFGIPPERITVIPNGIDVDEYKPTFNPDLLRRYGVDPDLPFVLFVGRITRQKGVTHLVNAIRWIDPGLQIVLCAGAPDTKEIGAEVAHQVEHVQRETGRKIVWISRWVPRPDVICLFSHAALFVCPSVYEPFGIINLEAMACETPVVATSVGGIPEVVVPEETGLLVSFEPASATNPEPRDPERLAQDLATAINELFHSPDRLKSMRVQARRRVEDRFSWRSVARQTLSYYEELVRAARTRAANKG